MERLNIRGLGFLLTAMVGDLLTSLFLPLFYREYSSPQKVGLRTRKSVQSQVPSSCSIGDECAPVQKKSEIVDSF